MLSVELASLTHTIADGIARRGFFLLMDERIALLCGDNANPAALASAVRFAASHGWEVECAEGKLLFRAIRNGGGDRMQDTLHLATGSPGVPAAKIPHARRRPSAATAAAAE
jgi:hypothetical protein